MSKGDRRFGLSKRAYRKHMSFLRNLFRQLKKWMRRRLRGIGQQRQTDWQLRRSRGFVLPTAVLIVLVLSITIGALLFRTLNRTTQVAGGRQDTQVLNTAAPALDRARSKLEYLFQDPRFPNGVPGEGRLQEMMLNVSASPDPYTFADETRIDLDGDGTVDNAWYFQPSGSSIVAYSILMQRPTDTLLSASDADKAEALVTRSRPLETIADASGVCAAALGAAAGGTEGGWDPISSSTLRKNFQINAFVFENRNGGQALATIDMVQERQLDRGNKWGAWFRNDLEIFPGPAFRWNGAIHTEGSLIVGDSSNFTAYLVSSPSSCIYTPSSSEITVTQVANETGGIVFQGQIVNGSMKLNNFNGSSNYHVYRQPPAQPVFDQSSGTPGQPNNLINADRDSVASTVTSVNPIALNPIALQTEDVSRARGTDTTNTSARDTTWDTQYLVQQGRIFNQTQPKPYVDDTYRADNRYGPKPIYDRNFTNPDPDLVIPSGSSAGDAIPTTNTKLTRNNPPTGEGKDDVGLDGYWERRARQEGLRIIVGERLELGKALDAPSSTGFPTTRINETLQRRTLRDNLAAAQGTVLYHYKAVGTTVTPSIPDPSGTVYAGNTTGGFAPIACQASTYHSGTSQSALRSISYNQYSGVTGAPQIFSDFFTGRGTDGWEYTPATVGTDMTQALTNLVNAQINGANVASDSDGNKGAFPPTQESSGTVIHPNPQETRNGNFSNLKRALGIAAADRSLADNSYIDSAACTMGMLADSVNKLTGLSYSSLDATQLATLNADLGTLSDGAIVNNAGTPLSASGELSFSYNSPTSGNPLELVTQLYRPNISSTLSFSGGYLPSDAFVSGAPANWAARPLPTESTSSRLARLIALKEQVNYDLNPSGYSCGIDGSTYPNLARAFCLTRPGMTVIRTAATTTQPAANSTTDLAFTIETPPNYDFRPFAENEIVYVAGLGRYRVAAPISSTTLTLRRLATADAGDAPVNSSIPTGGRYSVVLNTTAPVTRDLSATFSMPNTPTAAPNTSPTTVTVTVTGSTSSDYAVGDHVYIGRGSGASNAAIAGRFRVTSFDSSTGQLGLTYLGGTSLSGSGSTTIPVTARVTNLGPGVAPIDTYNSVRKYPILQALFNPGGAANVAPSAIAYTPKAADFSNFTIPNSAGTAVNGFPGEFNQILSPTGDARNIAFLDTGLYNGRENMAVRAMDLDLNLLRSTTIGGDTWLPLGGIVYAFREDAVREDGIARPVGTWMNTNPTSPSDPGPGANNISIKPVDMFADPMRRPNGFRLRNGVRVDRSGLTDANKNIRGISLVTDNVAYIHGNFNWHSTNGSTNNANRLEEFTTLLPDDFNPTQFYGRTNLDTRFARPTTDTWRPVEIVADAISITSTAFCPGSANDYFAEAYNANIRTLGANSPENVATNYPNNTGSGARVTNSDAANRIYTRCGAANTDLRTSFLNAARPSGANAANTVWRREDPFDPTTPIYVGNNGTPAILNHITGAPGNYGGAFRTLAEARSRNSSADGTRVNAVIISGITPSRPNMSYGGMHNFPRFLEAWNNLWIQGSFIQLNFSNQGTAPFSLNDWEASSGTPAATAFSAVPANTAEQIPYYGAPARRWGYDVGLQLAPAGPIADRFTSPARNRSEFFAELPADDPYILRLRCATRADGTTVDPTVTGCPT